MNLLGLFLSIFSFVEAIETAQIIVFSAGLLLIFAEMFTPGIGFAGIGGFVMLIIGIIMTARTPLEALTMVIILILLMAALVAILLRSAKKGKLAKKLILWSAAKHEDGFSTNEDNSQLVGQVGVANTVLRPAGMGEFSGRRMDVVSEGSFIEAGAAITIVRVEGRRIVVALSRPSN
ncbi:MAG: NfeD family protein [Eubacteriales bacterium]|nr:NfeD family protein [Eubacteriales bacterium]